MRKLLLASVLFAIFMMVVWASSVGSDFSGTWVLDAAKSEGLPPQMQGDMTWVIVLEAKTIKKEVQGGMMAGKEYYNLESEVNEDVNRGQFSGKAKRTAKVMGEMVELKTVMTGEFNGNSFTVTTTQHLELSDGGKTLKIHQTSDFGQGTREAKLVFTKK